MEEKHDHLKEIMKMAKLEMPFQDFDAKLLARIEKIEEKKRSISKTRKYALISFIFGALFGMGFNYLVSEQISSRIVDVGMKNNFMLISQFIYVVLFVILSDKILKLRQMRKKDLSQ